MIIDTYFYYFFLPTFLTAIAFMFLVNRKEVFSLFIPMVFVSAIASLIFFGIFYNYKMSNVELVEVEDEIYEIIALDFESATGGSFFIGSGTIDSKMYYHFFIKESEGIKYTKASADEVFIVESIGTPRYVIFSNFMKNSDDILYTPKRISISKKILYVPRGTIKTNYKIN